MAIPYNNLSVVEYFGLQEDGHCGYCKRSEANRFTYGMWAHKMSVEVYQNILDRGWRRSGKYCYKPILDKTCCPQYTIRCNAFEFRLSKSQKRVIKRLNSFLANGIMPKRSAFDVDVDQPKRKKSEVVSDNESIEETERKQQRHLVPSEQILKPKDDERRERKSKFRRRQRKLEKLRARGVVIESLPVRLPAQPKPVEGLLSFHTSSTADCIKIVGNSHTLEIRLIRSSPATTEFNRTFQQSFNVYQKYQTVIHNDPSTESGYRRFLVDSPLLPYLIDGNDQAVGHPGYGSFHQQYWLDGETLIAVGVLDILPNCLSSKYFYYDTDYRPLALGVYSALQEIALVRRLHAMSSDLRYYYMGFYIHTCPKMRYKGHYRPSELLCPESYTWQPITTCQAKLDLSAYSRFEGNGTDDNDANVSLDEVKVLFNNRIMPYPVYKRIRHMLEDDENEVIEYARLLGKNAIPNILLYRSDN